MDNSWERAAEMVNDRGDPNHYQDAMAMHHPHLSPIEAVAVEANAINDDDDQEEQARQPPIEGEGEQAAAESELQAAESELRAVESELQAAESELKAAAAEAATAAAAEPIIEATTTTTTTTEPRKKSKYTRTKKTAVINRKLLQNPQRNNESEKLLTNQVLLETATRLNDAISELLKYASALSDDRPSNSANRKMAIKNIRESILPMLHIAAVTARDAGLAFSPFGGTSGLHSRNDTMRKNQLVDRTSERSPGLQMIDDFVKKSVVEIPDRLTQSAAIAEGEREGEESETITILKPLKGEVYTRSEALRVLKMYKKGTPKRGIAMRAMIEKGFALTTTKALTKLCQDDERGRAVLRETWDEPPVGSVPRPNARKSFRPSEVAAVSGLGRPKSAEMIEVTIPKKRGKGKSAIDLPETESVVILRPVNGASYTRSEALRVCKMYKKGSQSRGRAVRAMIEKGFVPASAKTVNRLCSEDEKGREIAFEDWLGTGRPKKHFSYGEVAEATAKAVVRGRTELGPPRAQDMMEVTMRKKKRKAEIGVIGVAGAEALVAAALPSSAILNAKEGRKRRKTLVGKMGQETAADASSARATKAIAKTKLADPKAAPSDPPPKPQHPSEIPQVISFPLPPPRTGQAHYLKSEAVDIARQYQKGSQERKWCIEAMRQRGYVPNSTKAIYRLLQKEERGELVIDSEWASSGSPPLLSNKEVDVIIERLKAENGRIYGKHDVEQLLVNAVRDKVARAGRDPNMAKIRFSGSSVRNYQTIFMSKLGSAFWSPGDDMH